MIYLMPRICIRFKEANNVWRFITQTHNDNRDIKGQKRLSHKLVTAFNSTDHQVI